jgi:hypothetical protein
MRLRRLLYTLVITLAAAGTLAQSDSTPPAVPPTLTPLPAFRLGPGSTIEGNIVANSPSLRYQFDATVGDTVSIRMDTTSGDLDPFLTLFGPDQELVEQDDDSGGARNAAITTTLSRTGTYTVEASRYTQGAQPSAGTFRLSLEIAGSSVENPTDPLASVPNFGIEPAPTLIAYQEPGAGLIDDLTENHYYAIGGQQGDLLRVSMSTTEGDLSPQLDVLNRSQMSIVSSEVQTRPTESIAYATLPETGWYLINAGRRSGVGSYNIYVDRLVAGAVLSLGDAVTGQLTPDTPTTSYVFNARMGDLVAATMFATEGDSGIQPELRLLNVSFQNIGRAAGSRFATLRATIPRSGTYILQVNNLRPEQSGGFNLRLTGVSVDVSKLPVVPINYNERSRGFVSNDAPISYYRFSGKAGERVTIQMSTTSGGLDPFLILSEGNLNEELTFNDNVSSTRNARIVRYRLEKDGDYLILATRAGLDTGTTIGGFDIALTVGDIALTPGAVSASLMWNAAADLNLFVRDPQGRIVSWSSPRVPSGGTLQIDSNTNCDTPTDQPIEYVYWPQETLVSGDYEVWAWYQNPCSSSGPVPFSLTVSVGTNPLIQTGTNVSALQPGQRFEVRLRVTDDGSAFILDAGQITNPTSQQSASEGGDRLILFGETDTNTISDDVYARFYQFEGKQGDQIVVSVEALDGNLDPVVILTDAANRNLPDASNDDADASTKNARLAYTLPADGEYIIAVTRFGVRDGTTAGQYRLSLQNANPG